jgi:hypothetical protein
MSYKKKLIFLNKEIIINSFGQIIIKKRFTLNQIYRYYRFIK